MPPEILRQLARRCETSPRSAHCECPRTQASPTDAKRDEATATASKRSPQPPRLLQSYYDSMQELERRNRSAYEAKFIGAMSIVVCCVTGCEHGLATWLSPFGIEQGGLSEQRMALMSSTYWGVMCAGRVLWAGLSGVVSSTCVIL